MNEEIGKRILDKIRAYQRIFLFRHVRVDGDCLGASKGLKEILRLTYPEKEIYLIDGEQSDYLAFLGPDDPPVPDAAYADALGVALDTGTADRLSNPRYGLCRELIKIDHHLETAPYGDIAWVEPGRSSTCEMIAAFYDAFRRELKINRQAATFLYTGMVTDSGRFQFPGVTGDTLRYAALLLDQGIDTEMLYAHLYLKDFETLKFQAYVYEHMSRTENGVAHFYIGEDIRKEFGLTLEEASAAISYLGAIRGCLCWLAFIETGDAAHTIRVRLRSRFVPINGVAEHYRGGGHACASGATVYTQAEVQALLAEADATVRAYKESHEGWL